MNKVNAGSNQEYIEVITGGPKKHFNRRKVRNPLYKKAAKSTSPSTEHLALSQSFRHTRLKLGLSQMTLASKMRTHQSVISKFELGQTNPTLKFLERLAKILGKQLIISAK